MAYLYTSKAVIDPLTMTAVVNANLQFYAEADTGHTTPLAVTDPSGAPLTFIKSNHLALSEPFISDVAVGVLSDGTYSVPVDSSKGMQLAAEAAAAVAQAASSAASTSAAVASEAAATVGTFDERVTALEAGGGGGGGGGGSTAWADITGKPATFSPSAHTHPRSEISDASTLGRQLLGAVDAQTARALMGAGTGSGTSDLQLGTTASTAAPGNHAHSQYVDAAQAAAIADTRIAASGGGSGGGQILVWEYRSGAYPTLPASKPTGVVRVDAAGPVAPSSVPSWIGPGTTQARLRYDYDPTLT
jgi:hypothetical protein